MRKKFQKKCKISVVVTNYVFILAIKNRRKIIIWQKNDKYSRYKEQKLNKTGQNYFFLPRFVLFN
jgi:hypothetical protein